MNCKSLVNDVRKVVKGDNHQDILQLQYYIHYFLIIQYSSMTEPVAHTTQQNKKEAKVNNRWTNISSDEDESESEHSQKEQQAVIKPKQEQKVSTQVEGAKEEVKKKEPNIVPFDAKKKFRGEFANIKTVKGGFKAEKLQQKKFRLDTVKNPFQVDDQSSDQEKEEPKVTQQVKQEPKQQQEAPVQQLQQKGKKTKKSKKQQQKEQLQALLKELNVTNDNKAEEGQKKKKKKKPKKEKVEGQQQAKEQTKPQPVKQQPQAVQAEVVNRQAIEEVMRKKAEAAKNTQKKGGKQSVASNARKAIQQRQAKNKQKKVYVDL